MALNNDLFRYQAQAINDGEWDLYGYDKDWHRKNRETAAAFDKAYSNAMKYGLTPEEFEEHVGFDGRFGDPLVQALYRKDPSFLKEKESRRILPDKPGMALPAIGGAMAGAPVALLGAGLAKASPKLALGLGGLGVAIGASVAKGLHDDEMRSYEKRLKTPSYTNAGYNDVVRRLREKMADR